MERPEKKSVLTQVHLNLENRYRNFLTGVHDVCTEEAASKWTPLTLHPAAEKNFSNSDIHTFQCSRIVLWFDKNETFLNPSSKVLLLGYQNQPNGPPLTLDIILADTIPGEMHPAGGNQFNYLFLVKANKWLKRAPSLCTEAFMTQSVTLYVLESLQVTLYQRTTHRTHDVAQQHCHLLCETYLTLSIFLSSQNWS